MEEHIIKDLLGKLLPKMQENGIQKVYMCTRYTESGSSTTEGNYLDKEGNTHIGLVSSSKKLLREYQNQTKTDLGNRFNKVEFEIYKDGTYKANYYWDEAEDKDQKLKTAELFPIWLHERFLQFLFEAGYGDNSNWQKGIFKTHINKERNINIETTLYNKDIAFSADPKFPKYVYESVLHHYEITNHGLLSNVFKKWDTLIIHSRYTSVDLEKDVEYHLES
jgi:hypothetical protein